MVTTLITFEQVFGGDDMEIGMSRVDTVRLLQTLEHTEDLNTTLLIVLVLQTSALFL